jgi:hypothetical protein
MLPGGACPGEGLLTEPQAGAQPRRQEPLFVPLSGHCLMPVWGDPTNRSSVGYGGGRPSRTNILSRAAVPGELALRERGITNSYDADHPLAAVLPSTSAPGCCRSFGHRCVHVGTPSLSIQVIFGFGLSSQQSILDHVKQQFLNGLLQRNGLLGAQKHSRHGDFPSRLPHNMARLHMPEL